jgi:hypothetical protein
MQQPVTLFVTRSGSDPGFVARDGLEVSGAETVYSEVFRPSAFWSMQVATDGGLIGTWSLWGSDRPRPDPASDDDWVDLSSHSGFVETNPAADRALLDLDVAWNGLDTIIEAVAAGLAGNAISFETVADGTGAGEITVDGTDVVFHYESGTTTVANFETAVAALTGADAIIRVETGGTGMTVLAAPGDTEGPENLAAGDDDETGWSIMTANLYSRWIRLKFVSTGGTGTVHAYATNHPA